MKKDEITIKNTKQEILDALNEALKREKENAKLKSNPEEEEKKRKVQNAVVETQKNVEQNIFSAELNNKFNDLELAIKAEEEKLKNLYGVENELNDLTLVVNAGKDFLKDLASKKENESERIEKEIKKLNEEFKNKMAELNNEYELTSKNLKKEREREIEEYNYQTKREREIDNNTWLDEKKTRELALKSQEDETTKLLNDAKEKAAYLEELEKKVADIPNLLAKEYERGNKDTKAELEKEHKYEIEMLKKDFQNTIDRQNDKIESYKEEIANLNNLNANLQEKTDKAYAELKELATKTVEANGGVKILGQNTPNENK